MLNESQQAGLQSILAGLGQFNEAKRLEPTLGGPHGKHDFRALADSCFAEVKDYFDF